MGQLVGGIAGAVVGGFFGGPAGAKAGFAIGSMIGGALGPKPPAPAVGSLAPTEVEYGWGIPIIEGTRRAATWRLWQPDLEAVDERVETKGSSSRTVGYRYRCNMGLLICRRGVGATVRIWRNKEMVATFRTDSATEDIVASLSSIHWQAATFYAGDDDQLPHPVYEAALGDVPAYVGWATLWIDGAWCEGRTPPAIEVEVTTGPLETGGVVVWTLNTSSTEGYTIEPGSVGYDQPDVVPLKSATVYILGNPDGYAGTTYWYSHGAAIAEGMGNAFGAITRPGETLLSIDAGPTLIFVDESGGKRHEHYAVNGVTTPYGPQTYYFNISTWIHNTSFIPITGMERWITSTFDVSGGAVSAPSVGPNIAFGASDVPAVVSSDAASFTRVTLNSGASMAYAHAGVLMTPTYALRGNVLFFGRRAGAGDDDARVWRYAVGTSTPTHTAVVALNATVDSIATDGVTVWVAVGGNVYPLNANDLSGAGASFTVPNPTVIFCNRAGSLYSFSSNIVHQRVGTAWVDVLDVSGGAFNQFNFVQVPTFEGGVLFAIQSATAATGYVRWDGVMSTATTTPTGTTLNAILSRYMQMCGVSASQIELTETVGIEVPGYTAQGSGKYVVDELATAYNFNLVNDGRYLRTRLRGQASVATIEYADLGVGVDQAEAEPLEADTDSAVEVPRRISVSAANVDSDHEVETQTDDRLVGPNVQTDSISLALSETPDRIKGIANTIAADRKTGANTGRFAVGLDWIELELGDVVSVVGRQGETRRVRLVRETFADWVRQFEWALDRVADIQTAGIVTTSGSAPTLTVQTPGSAEVLPLDSPLERDADNTPGQYVAVDLQRGAASAGVYHARSETGAFENLGTVSIEAKVGTLLTTLRGWSGRHGWDAYSTVDVLMSDGATLTGSTKAAMHADLSINNVLIGSTLRGWERARFVNATLIATDTYRVSVMLRAQKGTETLAHTHVPGERLIVLAQDGFLSTNFDLSQAGTHWWKAVAPGRNISTAAAVSSPFTSVRTKPLAPNRLRAVRDAAGNITLTWSPRTRFGTSWRTAVFPNSEALSQYRVEFFAYAALGVPVRVQTVSATTAAYTAAQQTADGISNPARITLRITPLGATGQPGYPLESVI